MRENKETKEETKKETGEEDEEGIKKMKEGETKDTKE
jgi:hypothetical protein